jgi:nitrate reductase gamma subunit
VTHLTSNRRSDVLLGLCRTSEQGDAMRYLLVAVAISGLIATYAVKSQFAPSRFAEAGMTSGISVYQLHLGKSDMKTLPEQDAPLP